LANKKSADKRHRQSIGRRARNRMSKSSIKTAIKKFLAAVEQKDKVSAENEYKFVQKLLDTASGKGILHANMIARKKSRLSQHLNAI